MRPATFWFTGLSSARRIRNGAPAADGATTEAARDSSPAHRIPSAPSMQARSSEGRMGFVTRAAFHCSHCAASSPRPRAESTMTGMCAFRRRTESRRSLAIRAGSRITRSNRREPNNSSAWGPLATATADIRHASSILARMRRLVALLSMTRASRPHNPFVSQV